MNKLLSLLFSLTLVACSKIDNFDKPHMLEGYSGIIKVTPGIEGITAPTYGPALFFFNSNKTGTEVVMYGPGSENFSLYKMLPDNQETKDEFQSQMTLKGISKMDKLDFSGFRAHVDPKNGKIINFYGFGGQSEGMKKFKWKVEGSGLIDGPDSKVNLKISTTVGVLQDLLPNKLLKELGSPKSGLSLAEIEDKNEVVYLAQIEILGESLTIGY